MSQNTRALVERLKLETTHLPGNVPLHNKALETITEIFDSMVEPAEEPEEVEDTSEPEAEPEAAADESAGDEAAGEAEEGAEDESGDPGMTTENSPT